MPNDIIIINALFAAHSGLCSCRTVVQKRGKTECNTIEME